MFFDCHSLTFACRFAPLLEKNASQEDPSRVLVTASIAGIGVGTLGEHATFGYSASKGKDPAACDSELSYLADGE